MKTLTVPAGCDQLDTVQSFVDEALDQLPCTFETRLQIQIAVEELFVNIASYALLLQMMAQVTGFEPGDFIHTTGDTHLYLNHLDQARLQVTRTPRPLPRMKINPDVKSIFDFKFEDFELEGYDPWPHIKAEVSV